MMSERVLELEEVTKIYLSGDRNIYALNNVNLKIKSGEFVVVMGPSGSGKTTLLNSIAGLTKTEGKIVVNGKLLQELSDNQKAEIRRKDIGFIFQFYNLHEGLSAVENIELPMMISRKYSRIDRIKRSHELLGMVSMSHRESNLPYELSGGEKQRIGIARAFSNDPAIILGDEPTGDLDSKLAGEVIDLLLDLNKRYNKTFIIVTHDHNILRKGMRLLKMQDGTIIDDLIIDEDRINDFILETESFLKKSQN
ncbi:MAG: ABC transporter ATP-binding protein [Candidatus Thorarchaeota archaeon]